MVIGVGDACEVAYRFWFSSGLDSTRDTHIKKQKQKTTQIYSPTANFINRDEWLEWQRNWPVEHAGLIWGLAASLLCQLDSLLAPLYRSVAHFWLLCLLLGARFSITMQTATNFGYFSPGFPPSCPKKEQRNSNSLSFYSSFSPVFWASLWLGKSEIN